MALLNIAAPVREFIELNEWQIEEIENSIKEADAGDFANEQEVQAMFAKWGLSGFAKHCKI